MASVVASVVMSEVDAGFSEVVEQGALNGQAMLIVASFFMLGDAEVAAATTVHLHVDTDKKVMMLTLTVSKKDVKSFGIKRSWGAWPVLQYPRSLVPVGCAFWCVSAGGSLLFPTSSGEIPTKAKVVASIKCHLWWPGRLG